MRRETRAILIAPLLLAGLAIGMPRASRAALPGTPPRVTLGTEYGALPSTPAALAGNVASPLALAARQPKPAPLAGDGAPVLGGARARILLQSLTIPGWGQASLGRSTSATVFATIEAGIWTSFVAFKVQQALRVDAYVRTARVDAGIDLRGRDESFRRIVGQFPNSDDYNLFVVYRDAANQFYGDPAAMNDYIQKHSLSGAETWVWPSPESYALYQDQRKSAQRAALRANTALGLAVANRIISALHAARYAGAVGGHATRIEVGPAGDDFTGGRVALTTHF